MKRRLLSLTMALALCLSLLPVTALAGDPEGGVSYIYYTWDDANKTLSEPKTGTQTATEVTVSDTEWKNDSSTTGGWYVAQSDVTINQRVTVTGEVHLILADGCTLTVNGGIQVTKGNSLTIYGQSENETTMGKLIAQSTYNYNAGIGGGSNGDGGTVTIYSGTVEATGGDYGAGIGGGGYGSGGTVTIYGGTVEATGGGHGAGIGGGISSDGGEVTIYGGTVEATVGDYGAGIGGSHGAGIGGGGSNGSGGEVTISGGTVEATGGNYGAGIGGGYYGAGGQVTISGGTVEATGGSYGAGIGGGYLGSGGSFSTGDNGNAVIFASSAVESAIQDTSGQNGGWQGVFFLGNEEGKIYGTSVTPAEDFTIPSDKTLTIENGKTLTIQDGVTLTNEGTVNNYGTVENRGTITTSGHWINKVTGITLTPASPSLTVGDTTTLTAAVTRGIVTGAEVDKTTDEPAPSSWTWTSSGATVATVEVDQTDQTKATVTAVGPGSATITATAADGSGVTATCTVTVTQPVTGVTLDQSTLSLTVGGSATLTATVTPSNATNPAVTWTSDNEAVAKVENGTVTAVGAGTATITVTTQDGSKTATCTVTVTQPSGGGGGGGGSRPDPTPTPSQQATDKIESAKDGDTVTIDLPDGKTTLDKEVFEELAGRDVTLELDLGDGVSWTIHGLDIPADAALTDLNMGVAMDTDTVPVDLINAITGEVGTMQLTLAHDGDFGFTLTLTAPLGSKNAGYWANLYYFDEDAETLTFQTSAKISEDGSAALVFTHASQYVIVVDDRDHTPKDFPFVDVRESDWFYEAVDYVFQRDLMNGTDATHFTPDGTASRAMVATILWRMAGQPQVNYAMDFADVPVSAWYAEAVRWAASEGIVTGYSDTKFGPDDPVTREQFAAMLYRYAQTLGEGFTGSWSFPLDFPDADQVSDYAYEALCWMTMENVIQGMEDGGLHPQGTANRAQLATMLQRFCQTADL